MKAVQWFMNTLWYMYVAQDAYGLIYFQTPAQLMWPVSEGTKE